MKIFDVYPTYPIELEKASMQYLWDDDKKKYLDLYGGHAVISIGHSHPVYVKAIQDQVAKLGYYSNSVRMPLQESLAEKLSDLSAYPNHQLFMCNSGAEANENALKLASFHTGRAKILAFHHSFHGRTSASVEATDNDKIKAAINQNNRVDFIALNDEASLIKAIKSNVYAAVIIEGIQGVGGLDAPSIKFLQVLRRLCSETNTVLILDEIQSGFGRSGKFFAHQYAHIQADIISMAKGMGNGFPVGGILIHPDLKPKHGMLGTTFGGNHLACTAVHAVLDIIKKDKIIDYSNELGLYFYKSCAKRGLIAKGKGLMLGIDFKKPIGPLRNALILEKHIFTGASSNPNVLRILPPMCINTSDIDAFFSALDQLNTIDISK